MSNPATNPPPGWYRDPAGGNNERFWDGIAWSQATRDLPPAEPTAAYGPYGGNAAPGYYAPAAGYPMFNAEPQYAGFWWRFLGYIVDGFILNLVVTLVASVLGAQQRLDVASKIFAEDLVRWLSDGGTAPVMRSDFTAAALEITIIGVAVYSLYRVAFLRYLSATPGQLAIGVRVREVTTDPAAPATEQLSWRACLIRGVLGGVLYNSMGFINGIFAAFTSKKQTLSDLASGTVVYKVR